MHESSRISIVGNRNLATLSEECYQATASKNRLRLCVCYSALLIVQISGSVITTCSHEL
jgi:hypothetical protein